MARARPPVHPDLRRAWRADPRLLGAAVRAGRRAVLHPGRAAARHHARRASAGADVLDALVDGARNTLAVAMACACAGIVIGCVTITGLGIVFTQFVIALAQNSLVAALVLTALAGHRARHGHADDARLHRHGVAAGAGDHQARRDPARRAHVRVLLRDPVGDHAAGRARGLRGGGPRAKRTCGRPAGQSVRVAAPAYIVPFMFIYEPSLMLIGDCVHQPHLVGLGGDRRDLPRRRLAGLPAARSALVGARRAAGRGAPVDQAGIHHATRSASCCSPRC